MVGIPHPLDLLLHLSSGSTKADVCSTVMCSIGKQKVTQLLVAALHVTILCCAPQFSIRTAGHLPVVDYNISFRASIIREDYLIGRKVEVEGVTPCG